MINYIFKGKNREIYNQIQSDMANFDITDCPLIKKEQIEELADQWDIVSKYLACYPFVKEISLAINKDVRSTSIEFYRQEEKVFIININNDNEVKVEVDLLEKRYLDDACNVKKELLNLQNYEVAKNSVDQVVRAIKAQNNLINQYITDIEIWYHVRAARKKENCFFETPQLVFVFDFPDFLKIKSIKVPETAWYINSKSSDKNFEEYKMMIIKNFDIFSQSGEKMERFNNTVLKQKYVSQELEEKLKNIPKTSFFQYQGFETTDLNLNFLFQKRGFVYYVGRENRFYVFHNAINRKKVEDLKNLQLSDEYMQNVLFYYDLKNEQIVINQNTSPIIEKKRKKFEIIKKTADFAGYLKGIDKVRKEKKKNCYIKVDAEHNQIVLACVETHEEVQIDVDDFGKPISGNQIDVYFDQLNKMVKNHKQKEIQTFFDKTKSYHLYGTVVVDGIIKLVNKNKPTKKNKTSLTQNKLINIMRNSKTITDKDKKNKRVCFNDEDRVYALIPSLELKEIVDLMISLNMIEEVFKKGEYTNYYIFRPTEWSIRYEQKIIKEINGKINDPVSLDMMEVLFAEKLKMAISQKLNEKDWHQYAQYIETHPSLFGPYFKEIEQLYKTNSDATYLKYLKLKYKLEKDTKTKKALKQLIEIIK